MHTETWGYVQTYMHVLKRTHSLSTKNNLIRFFHLFSLDVLVLNLKRCKCKVAILFSLCFKYLVFTHNKMLCMFIFLRLFFMITCDRNIKNSYENEFVNKAFWTQPFIVRSKFLKWTTTRHWKNKTLSIHSTRTSTVF